MKRRRGHAADVILDDRHRWKQRPRGAERREPPLMMMAIFRRQRRNVQIVCSYEYQFEKVLVVLFVGSLSHEGSLSE